MSLCAHGQFYYVYILESLSKPGHFYTGFTRDPEIRLEHHNAGRNPATCSYKPWRLKALIALPDRKRAESLEEYLKSGSGRAFAKKHL